MGILLIVKDGLKKKKGNFFVLFLLITLSMMLMYVGTSVLTNMEDVIDESNRLTNGCDLFFCTPDEKADEIKGILDAQESIVFSESEKAIVLNNSSCYKEGLSEEAASTILIFMDYNAPRTLSTINVLEEGEEWKENSIVIPYYMYVAEGYKTGDTIVVEYRDKSYSFEVYGFSEDVLLSTPTNMDARKFMISSEMYTLMEQETESYSMVIRADVKDGVDVEDYEGKMTRLFTQNIEDYTYAGVLTLNYKSMRTGTTVTSNILMGVLTLFSVLLVLVALIIMRFNIRNSMEMNIKNIGVLESAGYTSLQLTIATFFENMAVGIVGMSAGLLIAISFEKVLGIILSICSGIKWRNGFCIECALLSFAIISALLIVTVFLTARMYKKVTPIMAMRSGVENHNFKKNIIKLNKTKLPINGALGVKKIFSDRVRNIGVCMIVAVLTFFAILAMCLYSHFTGDMKNMYEIIGNEVPDIMVDLSESQGDDMRDLEREIVEYLGEMDEVNYTIGYAGLDVRCSRNDKEYGLNLDIFDNMDGLLVDNVIEGRRPIHDNEVMITSLMAEKLDAKIGDVIYIESLGDKQDYIITGISQGVNHLGCKGVITYEGMLRANSKLELSIVYVYLNDANDTALVRDILDDEYGYKEISLVDVKAYSEDAFDSVTVAMRMLCAIMQSLVMIVIALILVLIIRTQIIREQKQIGIYKALGYTTKNLRIQMIANYLPIISAGSIVGCVVSVFTIKPAIVLVLSAFGVEKISLAVGAPLMLFVFLLTTIWSVLIILLSTIKIKKISPYEMISE